MPAYEDEAIVAAVDPSPATMHDGLAGLIAGGQRDRARP